MAGFLIACFAAFLALAYLRASARLWTAGAAMFLVWLALAGVITPEEHTQLRRSARLRDEVIRVDDFPQDFGRAEQALPAARRAAA